MLPETSYAHAFPLIRSGGLFLMIVGTAILLGSAWLRSRYLLLGFGAAVATIALTLSAVRLAAPYGSPTVAQVGWLAIAVALEIALLVLAIKRYAPRGERLLTIAFLFAVSVHFVPMTPAFGPAVALLGALGAANECLERAFPAIRCARFGPLTVG